jgi:hypothetical protein
MNISKFLYNVIHSIVGNLGKLTSNLIQKIKSTNITEEKEIIFMTKTDLS